MIFEKPILASKSIDVGGQTLTVYEFSADVYYNELLTLDDVAMYIGSQDKSSSKGQSVETPIEAQAMMKTMRDDNSQKQRYIAAALLPGYPDKDFQTVLQEVKNNLSITTVNSLFNEVKELNFPEVDSDNPKPATQAEPLSTDSPTT